METEFGGLSACRPNRLGSGCALHPRSTEDGIPVGDSVESVRTDRSVPCLTPTSASTAPGDLAARAAAGVWVEPRGSCLEGRRVALDDLRDRLRPKTGLSTFIAPGFNWRGPNICTDQNRHSVRFPTGGVGAESFPR